MFATRVRAILTGDFRREVLDVINEPHSDINECRIYILCDHDLPLFAGKSKNPLNRVEAHLGVAPGAASSTVGRLVRANIPQSYDWIVEFLTIEACVDIHWDLQEQIRSRIGWTAPVERSPLPYFTEDAALKAVIQYYTPCLNLAHNTRKRPLPTHYRLPTSELLDGLTFMDEAQSVHEYRVSYRAFDWLSLENKKYQVTVRAPSPKVCRMLIEQFLGYEPEELYVSRKEQPFSRDVPF